MFRAGQHFPLPGVVSLLDVRGGQFRFTPGPLLMHSQINTSRSMPVSRMARAISRRMSLGGVSRQIAERWALARIALVLTLTISPRREPATGALPTVLPEWCFILSSRTKARFGRR
jgi:hypothetical protein